MSAILVYSGDGVSPLSQSETKRTFQALFPSSSVLAVDHQWLLKSPWEPTTQLVIFPGGKDIPYDRDLKGKGTKKLRRFVQHGGTFIGICAGAYFASQLIEFEMGSPLEVCASRSLEFFPGKAIGTLDGPFAYNSDAGAHATPIKLQKDITPMYYNGGCYFENAEHTPNTEVIGTYCNHKDKAAIICCCFGKGRALLSGVHFEISAKALRGRGHTDRVVTPLSKGEENRARFLSSLDKWLFPRYS